MEHSSPHQPTIAVRVLISGTVQGVFYRASTQEQADSLGIHGWVRNLPDGRVEAWFEGTEETVDRMVQWCYQGSRGSRVTDVVVEEQESQTIQGFKINYD